MDDIGFRLLQLGHKRYCCSQILLILALENQGKSDPDLVRSMAGLGHGIGYSGELCGALSGAACMLALYGAKGADDEDEDPRFQAMLSDLVEWFRQTVGQAYGGICCTNILGDDPNIQPDVSRCGRIVADTYARAMEILLEQGFDPTASKEEQ